MSIERAGVLERIIGASIAHRWLMMSLTLVLVAVGIWSFTKLPIDATPDITNVQVQINTAAPGYSPLETEQRITYPVETVMAGLPRMEQARSLSRYGLSQVTVVFEDGTDIYFARQQVAERLQQVKSQIPEGLDPQLGRSPPASVRSSCTPSMPIRRRANPMAAPTPPPTCAPCRTG